ncbi:MAG: hypothetical protein KJO35_05845 [Gammaproteobacteria bacterium]|nr:hypothetical protein [Gammaproteobacteria bacterium]
MNNADNPGDKNRQGASTAIRGIIPIKANNLVERPWGGLRMLEYKGSAPLPEQKKLTGMGIGEAFEVAACPSDPESDAFPSIALMTDGSEITLPELLEKYGEKILGAALFEQFNGEIPLLPKTLDIEELLSVQAHPAGNTELYIIIDADPGASIRLGFCNDVNPQELKQRLSAGREQQEKLLRLLKPDIDQHQLHCLLAPALADRDNTMTAVVEHLTPWLQDAADVDTARKLLASLHQTYWYALDQMNEVAVKPGQVIYNATPKRLCLKNKMLPSAEVHALGNPAQKEILMLEIRRPGITYRAWDNVRFPVRQIDIEQALSSLNCSATTADEFLVTPARIKDGEPVFRSVDSDNFIVDHIRAENNGELNFSSAGFHTLHCISGEAALKDNFGTTIRLASGQSAIVPVTVTDYCMDADAGTELIRVILPQ